MKCLLLKRVKIRITSNQKRISSNYKFRKWVQIMASQNIFDHAVNCMKEDDEKDHFTNAWGGSGNNLVQEQMDMKNRTEIGWGLIEKIEPCREEMLFEEKMLWEQTNVLADPLQSASFAERNTILRNICILLPYIKTERCVKEEWKEILNEEGTKTSESKVKESIYKTEKVEGSKIETEPRGNDEDEGDCNKCVHIRAVGAVQFIPRLESDDKTLSQPRSWRSQGNVKGAIAKRKRDDRGEWKRNLWPHLIKT